MAAKFRGNHKSSNLLGDTTTFFIIFFFAPGVGFPLYPEIFVLYSQWFCSASGSLWEMPDSNPGPLPQKSAALAMSHHISEMSHHISQQLTCPFFWAAINIPWSGDDMEIRSPAIRALNDNISWNIYLQRNSWAVKFRVLESQMPSWSQCTYLNGAGVVTLGLAPALESNHLFNCLQNGAGVVTLGPSL